MKAGREMDALVAEKVMGLVLTCPVDARCDHSVGTNRDGTSAKRNFCRWPDGKEHWIPFYSTDIADAWQVVEKLKANGNNVWVEWAGTVWVCGTTSVFPDIEADTATLAICKAALKAVGVEMEKS